MPFAPPLPIDRFSQRSSTDGRSTLRRAGGRSGTPLGVVQGEARFAPRAVRAIGAETRLEEALKRPTAAKKKSEKPHQQDLISR